jgi:hypothetical protein
MAKSKSSSKKLRKVKRGACVQLSSGKAGFVVRARSKSSSRRCDVYLPGTKTTVQASRATIKPKRCSKTMRSQKRRWSRKNPQRSLGGK